MITIIKKGTKKEIDCNKCGCLFSYEEEDIRRELYGFDTGSHYEQLVVECPQCKHKIVLKGMR